MSRILWGCEYENPNFHWWHDGTFLDLVATEENKLIMTIKLPSRPVLTELDPIQMGRKVRLLNQIRGHRVNPIRQPSLREPKISVTT